jgi:nucleoid DNA-binding protein
MIKADIARAVAEAGDLRHVHAEEAVEAIIAAIKEALGQGQRLELRGFGVFTVKPRKRGLGRNPKTGQVVAIPPGRAIRFKPGKDLSNLEPDRSSRTAAEKRERVE